MVQTAQAQTSTEAQSSKRAGKGKEVLQLLEMEISSKNPSQMIFKQPISSQIVLKDQPILKKKSEYLEKLYFQNILTLEDGFSELKPFKTVLRLFPKNGILNLGIYINLKVFIKPF